MKKRLSCAMVAGEKQPCAGCKDRAECVVPSKGMSMHFVFMNVARGNYYHALCWLWDKKDPYYGRVSDCALDILDEEGRYPIKHCEKCDEPLGDELCE